MGPVLPVDVALADQLEIGLTDEGGGLQRADAPFARHVTGRDQVQLLVDERHQAFERVRAPAAPLLQQPRDVRAGFSGAAHGFLEGAKDT